MKKTKKTSKIRTQLKHKRFDRRIKNQNKKKRIINIFGRLRNISRPYKTKKRKQKRNWNPVKQMFSIAAPSNFSLLEYPDNVLSFIDKVDKQTKLYRRGTCIFDISNVTSIDIGSIGLLLSKVNQLSNKGIKVAGNFPRDESCEELIRDSGFLSYMRDLAGKEFKLKKENSNFMINRGFDQTSNELVGAAIRKVVKHLTGVENRYQPVYSIAQEMCANSIEHANKKNKNWLFSVWYKDDDTVCFTMTDIGSGILKTLERKMRVMFSETVSKDKEKVILENAFDKKHQSATKEINRNKGLPKIKSTSSEDYIDNLILITNNVYLDFNNPDSSKVLKRKFDGTFYYWELNIKCITKWKNRIL